MNVIGRCGGGGGSFTASIGRYNAGFASVAGLGGTLDASWTYVDGAALLDLTAPTFPTVLAKGLYLWTIGWAVQGGGVAGRPFSCNLYQGFSGPPLYHEEDDLVNPVGGFGIFGTFGDSGILDAGTGVKVRFVNNDNGAHNMEIQEAHVVFIPMA